MLETALPDQSRRLKIGLALLSLYLIWGSTYLALRIGVESFPPFMMTGVRFLIAGVILFAFQWMRGDTMPTGVQWRNASVIGAMMLGVGTGGVTFAEQWVASGLAATAVAAVPVWAALFGGLWGRWPTRWEWAGLILGLVGVALLNTESGMQANPLGAIALILGPMSWAFASIWSRRLNLPDGLMATAVEMIGGGAFLMVLSVIVRENLDKAPSTASVLAVIYLITFGALIAFSAYMYLLKQVRPAVATSYAYVNPIVAVFLGIVFANEEITLIGKIALVVILAGVALLTFGGGKKKAA
ncbi:MAG: drug/metabolite exporter YedA [Chitinophagaceae bacterium]|nr:drug/metabolite exporter YedA [Anaerolineae bacterium]